MEDQSEIVIQVNVSEENDSAPEAADSAPEVKESSQGRELPATLVCPSKSLH